MIRAISERLARSRRSQRGFTLIELLVVIIVLGVLSAVVVFAVRGTGDKGRGSAMSIDARTIRTAQEAYCAQNGRYGSAEELVSGKFLSEMPIYHQTDTTAAGTPSASGNCVGAGDPSRGSFLITCTEAQAGCGGGGALKLGWRAQSLPLGFPSTFINDVVFVDAQRGWAVGGENDLRILKTTDGGGTWTEVVTGILGLRGLQRIDCVDASHCWAVGDSGTIVRTLDGVNWSLPPNPLPGDGATRLIRGVDFLDIMNGWAVVRGTILRTVDGGDNWTIAYTGIPGNGLRQVQFGDAMTGWVVGGGAGGTGVVYRTTTGGGSSADWVPVTLPGSGVMNDVDFIDTLRGWVVGTAGRNFSSTDGGVTWAQRPNTCGNTAAVEFVNARQGWAVTGTACAASATSDGAGTWTVQATLAAFPSGFNGVEMLDTAHGWAVGFGRIASFGPVP